MLLDIPNKEKLYIGRVIDLRRKQLGLTVEFIIEGICSRNTYYKLQKEPILESEIYDGILKKLDLYYDYRQNTNAKDYSLIDLWISFRNENWKEFYIEKDNILRRIDSKNVKLYPISEALSRMKIEEKCSFDHLSDLLALLEYELKEMVLNFVITNFYEYKEVETYDYLDSLNIELYTNKVQYLFCLIKAEKYYNAVILCESLLKEKNQKNYHLAQLGKLYIIYFIQPNMLDEYSKELFNNVKLKEQYLELEFAFGVFCYVNKNYDKAWKYLSNTIKIEKYRTISLLYLNHMETITDYSLLDNKKYLSDISSLSNDKCIKAILYYYKLKNNNVSLEKLSDYLWNDCRKVTNQFYPEHIMKTIIRDELCWISSLTGDKKRFYRYIV